MRVDFPDENIGTFWVHKKSERLYEITGECRIEATYTEAYLYTDTHGVMWARPKAEFLDGRFEQIDKP